MPARYGAVISTASRWVLMGWRSVSRKRVKKKSRRAASRRGAPIGANQVLGAAVSLHQAGRLDAAEEAYRRFLGVNAGHPRALENLGLLLHQKGSYVAAVETLERAVLENPDDVGCRESLGRVLKSQGQLEGAIAAFIAALDLDPDHREARYQLGACYHDREDARAAAECYQEVLSRAPDYAPGWNSLGSAHMDLDELDEAERCLGKALELQPQHPGARLNRGVLLKLQRRFEEALEWLEALVRDWPALPEGHNNLATVLRHFGRLDEATGACREALRLRPDYENAEFNLAGVRFDQGNITAAIAGLRHCVELDPEHADAWEQLGSALLIRGETESGAAAVRRALEIDPDHPAAHNDLGFAYSATGDARAATACFERALELLPDFPAAWLNVVHQRRFTEADRDTIALVESIPQRRELGDWGRSTLSFALGRMHHDCQDYAKAFDHYRRANRLARKQLDFDIAEWTQRISYAIETFTPELFERARGFGDPSTRPVFVFGMPRSGTTLVEQILSSHPRVSGAGELLLIPDCSRRLSRDLARDVPYPRAATWIDRVTAQSLAAWYLCELHERCPDGDRVTDKLPGNYQHLGLIAVLFPNAQLIHCRRDPMDVCLSNYMQRYGEGHAYSYDLTELGLAYQQYERVMHHWYEVLPVDMYEVYYERLVAAQEDISRELVDFCGLEWDARCLEYFDNERAVTTASQWQVRQPIYRSSVARWKRYEPYLDELRRALATGVAAGS